MTKLVTILGILLSSSTSWAGAIHCENHIHSAAVARAAQVLDQDGIEFTTVQITIGQQKGSASSSGGELWIIQLEIDTKLRSYQKIEYISFDQNCHVVGPVEQIRSI